MDNKCLNTVVKFLLNMGTPMTTRTGRSATDRQSFGRNTNSPLPDVPLPAKTANRLKGTIASRLAPNNEAQQSASCGNLLESYAIDSVNSGMVGVGVTRANSTHFDQTCLMSQPLLPLNHGNEGRRI